MKLAIRYSDFRQCQYDTALQARVKVMKKLPIRWKNLEEQVNSCRQKSNLDKPNSESLEDSRSLEDRKMAHWIRGDMDHISECG